MNTPSELFNFYETYLNIYEAPFEITGPHSYKTGDGLPEQDFTIKNTPRVAGVYQGDDAATRKRARNKANKLNQEYGASVYRVNRTGVPRKRGTTVEDSVEYVLDYLIDEGFTDSYDGAEAILETMSDEWLEGIIDEANRWERESGIGGNSPEAEMARMRSRTFHTGGVRSMKAVNPSDINSASLKVNRGVAQMIHKRNRGKPPSDPTYSHRRKIDPLKIPSYRESPLGLPAGYKDPLRPRTNSKNPNRVGDRVNANVKPLQTEVPTNVKSNIRKFQRNDVEYVLDYLIDEGFTDSYDGAEAILETMSDEWLEGIVVEVRTFKTMSAAQTERFHRQVEAANRRRERTGSSYTKSEKEALDRLTARLKSYESKPQKELFTAPTGSPQQRRTTRMSSVQVK